MKNKRRAQIADNICFNHQNQNQKQLIQKGKQLIHEIPNIKILQQVLQYYYAFLIEPKPFSKFKNIKNKPKFDLHSNLQFLEKLKKSHFDRSVIESVLESEQTFIPNTKRYKNCLSLSSYYQGINKLEYIFENNLRSLIWKYDKKNIKINVEEFKEEPLFINDQTGIYQFQKYDNLMYLKHLNSIEILQNNKSVHRYSTNSQIFDFSYSEIMNKLFILTKNQLRSEDTIIKQFQPNISDPMIIQSFHLSQNPNQLFLQSFKEIQLFDMRKQNSSTLISKDLQDLLVNRIYGFHQFLQNQYFIISTNQDLQFYDLRNLRTPFSLHRHGCSENSPSEFVRMTEQIINFDDLINDNSQFNQRTDSSSESIIAYSNLGHSIFINFNSGLVDKVKNNLASLRTCQNLLVEKSIQYANDELALNGMPQLLCNSSIFNNRLRTLGFQFIFQNDKYFIFSLDKQGGLGVQLLDEYFNPIKNSQSCQQIINQISMIESEKYYYDQTCQNAYDDIFDEFDDINDSDLELVEIEELKPIVKKKKLNNFVVTDFSTQNEINENNVGFEEGLLLEESVEQQEDMQQIKQSQNFILTQEIISFLVKQT